MLLDNCNQDKEVQQLLDLQIARSSVLYFGILWTAAVNISLVRYITIWTYLPYAHHHNLLLITNNSWILTIHKNIVFCENLINGVKNIQAAGYNCYWLWFGLKRQALAPVAQDKLRSSKRNSQARSSFFMGLNHYLLSPLHTGSMGEKK